jgi:hypothetical protein
MSSQFRILSQTLGSVLKCNLTIQKKKKVQLILENAISAYFPQFRMPQDVQRVAQAGPARGGFGNG